MKNIKIICVLSLSILNLFCVNKVDNDLLKICQRLYIYAYPLVLMEITKYVMTVDGLYTNRFLNVLKFPDDRFKSIVRPNVDTLYSSAWLDLSKEPIILSVPDTNDRYYLLEFMDAWTNVFESIGKRTTGTKKQNFTIVGPFYKDKLPENLKIIKSPTNLVWILGRIQTNGKSDYPFVNEIQNDLKLTCLSDWNKFKAQENVDYNKMNLSKVSPEDIVGKMHANRFYKIFIKSLKNNPASKFDSDILKDLKLLNLDQFENEDINISKDIMNCLNKSMKSAIEQINENINNIGKQINGWNIDLEIGKYGTDYLKRATIAKIGIGANLPADAIYPTAFKDSKAKSLNGKYKYLIHFDKDSLPPANAFWSITMYNKQSFLVPNIINRYALGDRDNLQYNKDGSLDIYIQSKPVNKNKISNWLPAPKKDFNLTMRIYWPKESVLNGMWVPPAIQRIN